MSVLPIGKSNTIKNKCALTKCLFLLLWAYTSSETASKEQANTGHASNTLVVLFCDVTLDTGFYRCAVNHYYWPELDD